jgi:hypothetical protein
MNLTYVGEEKHQEPARELPGLIWEVRQITAQYYAEKISEREAEERLIEVATRYCNART